MFNVKALIVFILSAFIGLTQQSDWSYSDEASWGGSCHGSGQQSPINLVSQAAVTDYSGAVIRGPLEFSGYDAVDVGALNNGHTLKWKTLSGRQAPTVSGGPLEGNYTFQEFHLHWLSEHAIDGVKHPLEIHLLHAKSGYSVSEASKIENGLAVIAILFKVESSESCNEALREVIPMVPGITEPTGDVDVTNVVDLNRILGSDRSSYFTYQGSLTTPACTEGVTWIILDRPLAVSDEQFKLISKADLGGQANYRSLQPQRQPVYRSVSPASVLSDPPTLSTLFKALYAGAPVVVDSAKKEVCRLVNIKAKLLGLGTVDCDGMEF